MAEERVQRKLAAILVADVVGYSRLMEADEEGTRARLKSLHAEVIDPNVGADGGRVVKTSGDGTLVEFPSAVDAVRNAVRTQAAIAERNRDVPEDHRIVYRVGINVGDIIVDDDDIFGDGVNVASRLEGLSAPGEGYISGTVFDHVKDKLPVAFEDLGEQRVKNISNPVRMYRVYQTDTASAPAAPPGTAAPSPSDKPSVAVLPFANMSGDGEQEYFSDGITEDLITDLSKLSGLFVIARNSSFSFKGRNVDVAQVGRELGVAHVLEGSVRKAGNRVRINAQLIEAATGGHVWAERYDGNMDDIFAVQAEITDKIVAALQVRLTVGERAGAQRRVTDNVAAYELYLRARAVLHQFTPDATSESVRLLEQAITIDPGFAAAYASLSVPLQHGWTFMFPGFDDGLDRALAATQHAVALDDTMALTHTRLGWATVFVRRYDAAVASFERAIALEPNTADTYAWFCEALNFAGDPARGLEMIRRAMEINPVVTPVVPLVEGHSHYLLRDYDAALDRLGFTISLAPGFPVPDLFLAVVYSELGRPEDAVGEVAMLRKTVLAFTLDIIEQRIPYRDDEPRRRLHDALAQAGMPA